MASIILLQGRNPFKSRVPIGPDAVYVGYAKEEDDKEGSSLMAISAHSLCPKTRERFKMRLLFSLPLFCLLVLVKPAQAELVQYLYNNDGNPIFTFIFYAPTEKVPGNNGAPNPYSSEYYAPYWT